MRKVKNGTVIRRISDKGFQTNRTRNMIAILAIALTAMLFTTIFTMGLGLIESFQYQTAKQSGSEAHGSIKDITREQYEKMRKHPLIVESADCVLAAERVENTEFLKRHVELWYYPPSYYSRSFVDIVDGKAPEKADEILMDEVSMGLLGLDAKAGQEVSLTLKLHWDGEETITRNFTVSGVIAANTAMNVGFGIVSSAYLEAHAEELAFDPALSYQTGAIRLDIFFSNSMDIQQKLERIIVDSGYSTDEGNSDYVASNANWAYVSDGLDGDMVSIVAIIGGMLLVMLTGYLIIYNIFRISIMKDIRYYGLLKTIGTTARQIRRIVRRQAMWLGLAGVPLGLIVGFFVGKSLVPLMMALSAYETTDVRVSVNPLIFAGAAAFSIITLAISVMKPARMAAKVSPVEAVRYTEGSGYKKKNKKSTDGGRIYRMAFSNLARSRGKTLIVIVSFSLALILLNSIYTISASFDMDQFLKKFVSSDFMIGNAKYFGMDHYWGVSEENVAEECLTESFISACEGREGFEAGGRIYGAGYSVMLKRDSWKVPDSIVTDETGNPGWYAMGQFIPYQSDEEGNYVTNFYGVDDFILTKMEVWRGESDISVMQEKLAAGDYIIVAVRVDDNGKVEESDVKMQPGDKITLLCDGVEKEVTVLSLIKEDYYGLTNRSSNEFAFYTSADVFKRLISDKFLMSYAFNAANDKEAEIQDFLESYTETSEPMMNFESKEKYVESFEGMKNMLTLIGGLLTGVVGIIGVLNFVNSILTGIITRRREFAMLEAIGMTRKQLTGMVMAEGLYYVGLTAIFTLVFGILFSVTAVRAISSGMWFMSYHFTIVPIVCVIPVLIVVGGLVPFLALRFGGRRDIVTEIRLAE